MKPAKKQIEKLVKRIVDAVQPIRIVLFGSAARNEMGADSDLDVMVVMPEGTHRRRTAMFLYTCMLGMGIPVDIIVATPSDLEKHKDNEGLVYYRALNEGRELYAA
jgi:uncharacterized protein